MFCEKCNIKDYIIDVEMLFLCILHDSMKPKGKKSIHLD